GDGEVAIGDGRGYTSRKLEGADVNGVVDLQTREVRLDRSRNVLRVAQQLDFVANHVEHSAALEAGRLLFVQEVHRNLHSNLFAGANAHEVDVQRLVGHRVHLEMLREHPSGLPVELEIPQLAEEATLVDQPVERAGLDRNHRWAAVAAIDDAGNPSLTAGDPGAARAGDRFRLGFDGDDLAHTSLSPQAQRFRAALIWSNIRLFASLDAPLKSGRPPADGIRRR